MRTLVATLTVPIIAIGGLLLPAVFDPRPLFADVPSAVFEVTFQYMFILAFTAAVVLPLRLLWRRWNFMRAWVAVVIGLVVGCGTFLVFAFVYSQTPILASRHMTLYNFARGVSILGITGAVAGLIFWLIAKAEMRPNTSLERTRDR